MCLREVGSLESALSQLTALSQSASCTAKALLFDAESVQYSHRHDREFAVTAQESFKIPGRQEQERGGLRYLAKSWCDGEDNSSGVSSCLMQQWIQRQRTSQYDAKNIPPPASSYVPNVSTETPRREALLVLLYQHCAVDTSEGGAWSDHSFIQH